jgi:hypothetical protein
VRALRALTACAPLTSNVRHRMATTRDFLRVARSEFTPLLVKCGFSQLHKSRATFVRQRGPFLDLVHSGVWSRHGQFLDLVVDVWTPCLDPEPATFETTIDLRSLGIGLGGHVSERGVHDSGYWPCKSEGELCASTAALAALLPKFALPWFAQIVDAQSLIDHASLEFKRKLRRAHTDRIHLEIAALSQAEEPAPAFKFVGEQTTEMPATSRFKLRTEPC